MIDIENGSLVFRRGSRVERHTFAVPGETRCGPILVRSTVVGARVRVELVPDGELELIDVSLSGPCTVAPGDRILVNGYQSWTDTRELRIDEALDRLAAPLRFLLHAFGDTRIAGGARRPGRFHGFTYAYVRHADRLSFVGQVSEEGGYTVIVIDAHAQRITLRADVRGCLIDRPLPVFDIITLDGADDAVFDAWARARSLPRTSAPTITGWTSWYEHFTRVRERDVFAAADGLRALGVPADVIQIDDGYQRCVGDWLDVDADKFPRGMRPVADDLRARGYRPGLWIAPFVVSRKSAIARTRPELLEHDASGRPLRAGFNPLWHGTFYALDLENEDARAYVARVMKNATTDWGFELLKLDFLYAAALRHRKNEPRGARMRKAMRYLRELAPTTPLIACGVPLAAALGLCEYCRIGCDVSPRWDDPLYRFLGIRESPSTARSLAASVGRHHLNGLGFVNDPDVSMLRDHDIQLSVDERRTLFHLNAALGGVLFVSDDVQRYTQEGRALLRSMFPIPERTVTRVVHEHPRVDVALEVRGRRYRVLANLGERPQRFELGDLGGALCFERARGLFRGALDIGPHASAIVHVVESPLAASQHLFPCADIAALEGDTVRYVDGASPGGELVCVAPLGARHVRINGERHPALDDPALGVAIARIAGRVVQVPLDGT